MGRIANVKEQTQGESGNWLNGDAMDVINLLRVPFLIHELRYRETGKFGPNWVFTVEFETAIKQLPIITPGDHYTFSMADNDYRHGIFEGIQAEIVGVGPLMAKLAKEKTKGGQSAWTIIDAEEE